MFIDNAQFNQAIAGAAAIRHCFRRGAVGLGYYCRG
jgi:hypothetical protein